MSDLTVPLTDVLEVLKRALHETYGDVLPVNIDAGQHSITLTPVDTVDQELRRAQRRERTLQTVREYVERGYTSLNLVAAVKAYREAMGCGLREAHDTVKKMFAERWSGA